MSLPSEINNVRFYTAWNLDLYSDVDSREGIERTIAPASDLPFALSLGAEPAWCFFDRVSKGINVGC